MAGSSANVAVVELAETACKEEICLFARYAETLTAFQDAPDGPAKSRAVAVLSRAAGGSGNAVPALPAAPLAPVFSDWQHRNFLCHAPPILCHTDA